MDDVGSGSKKDYAGALFLEPQPNKCGDSCVRIRYCNFLYRALYTYSSNALGNNTCLLLCMVLESLGLARMEVSV